MGNHTLLVIKFRGGVSSVYQDDIQYGPYRPQSLQIMGANGEGAIGSHDHLHKFAITRAIGKLTQNFF